MKRLIKLLIGTTFAFMMLACLLPGAEAAAISGSGTAESPYVITSAAELQAVNDDLDAYYVLGNNISLNGQNFEPIGNEWDGPFTGTLDGKGFTISYLTVKRTDLKYAGLFGYMEGTVQNLKLANVNISGGRYAGGVAGAVGVGGAFCFHLLHIGLIALHIDRVGGGLIGDAEIHRPANVPEFHIVVAENGVGGQAGFFAVHIDGLPGRVGGQTGSHSNAAAEKQDAAEKAGQKAGNASFHEGSSFFDCIFKSTITSGKAIVKGYFLIPLTPN